MTENMVGAICALIAFIAFLSLVALRIWVDHKEEMRPKE
jgi:hypothetical protein